MKLDSLGDTLWTRRYSSYGVLYSIGQTQDSGLAATGTSGSPAGLLVMKTDKDGTTRWSRTYSLGTRYDYGHSIRPAADHGYIVVGECIDSDDADLWLVKTDSMGDTLWTRRYGGSDYDCGYSVVETPDHGYLAVGTTYSFGAGNADIWLLKTDSFGDTLWSATLGDTAADNAYCIEKTPDANYIIAGTTRSRGTGFYDYYLLKIALQTGIEAKEAPATPARSRRATLVRHARQAQPNGKFRLFDISGRPIEPGELGGLGPGVYFIRSERAPLHKIIIIR
jgi:hypothetical protein